MTLEQEVAYTEGLEVDEQSVSSKQGKALTLEQEIREFMYQEGIEEDMMGFAGPGRFDGPPSLDPTYVLKGAKSIISYAMPYAAEPIYDYLSKKTPLPHTIQLYKGNLKMMAIGRHLAEFLKAKGYRAKGVGANAIYRVMNNMNNMAPDFSHRYGAYVSGVAAPGLSGNAMTKRYGGAVWLGTVITDAVLESSPTMDPCHFIDHRCQGCLVCGDSCPTNMFLMDELEYSLINGELWPRGKKRQGAICAVSCGGQHALSHDKKWTNWSKEWVPTFVKEKPDPKKHNVVFELIRGIIKSPDYGFRTSPYLKFYADAEGKYDEELASDSELFPYYEDLEGETEGEKLKSFANHMSKIFGHPVYDPLGIQCEQCSAVCAGSNEENKKRYNMLINSGFVTYTEGNEPLIVDTFEEAVAQRKAYKYKVPPFTWIRAQLTAAPFLSKFFGIPDWEAIRKGKEYFKKLNARLREEGKPEYPPFS